MERRLGWVCGAMLAMVVCGSASAQAGGGMDAAAAIEQQDAQLGTRAGTVTLNQPSVLSRTVTLGANHALAIDAPLRFSRASLKLGGNNSISCTAPISVDAHEAVFVAKSVNGIRMTNCDAAVTGAGGGYLLVASGVSQVAMNGVHATNLGLFNSFYGGGVADTTTGVTINGSSDTFPKGGGEIGVYLTNVIGAQITNNRFEGTGHGVEWWGGDANGGWHGAASVKMAGNITVTGTTCKNAGGSCVWGSMGFNVQVNHNTADGCTDVCFDVEGGVNNVFTQNTARNCGNGCLAAEFESEAAVFSGNTVYGEGGKVLALIKHGSGNPNNHHNLVISQNAMSCTGICTALYTEGDFGLLFEKNTITNGRIDAVNYHDGFRIVGNTLRFTVDPGTMTAINAPALFNGQSSEISGNTITASVRPSGKSVCIAQSWSDYNAADTQTIAGNTCKGFGTGILTVSAGGNPGAPRAIWNITGNHVLGADPGKAYVHQHPSGNESYNFKADNTQ